MSEKPDYWHKNQIDAAPDEVEQLEETVSALEQQLREKEARIARLESICTDITCEIFDLSHSGDLERFENKVVTIFRETPQQSLAHIQADAIDTMTKWMYSQAETTVEDCPDMIDEYLAMLRGNADEPTA